MKTTPKAPATVVYHSADFDGIFCREIARRFLGDGGASYIGWNHGDAPLEVPAEGTIWILDLPADAPFGAKFDAMVPGLCRWPDGTDPARIIRFEDAMERMIWIDHHRTAIQSHPQRIPGYRIDGVAACRLAWQIFQDLRSAGMANLELLPKKADYGVALEEGGLSPYRVSEPLAVRLAGEYDVWDKHDPRAETLQYGLRCREISAEFWQALLSESRDSRRAIEAALSAGAVAQSYATLENAWVAKHRSFELCWEGLRFLCLNTARCNSLSFGAALKPEHDGLLGFHFNGRHWRVSLYGVPHKPGIDLSAIAAKHGGGGHPGACGFTCAALPFPAFSHEVSMDAVLR
jgi:hypothetical protein